MTMRLVMVRHAAHSELGRFLTGRGSDVPLSAEGEAQARVLAEGLAGKDLMTIQSSPRRRTLETARTIGARLDRPVEIIEALDEVDFGSWTGRSFEALEADPDWRRWNSARSSACPPGGETMAVAVARVVAHIGALVEQARRWPVLLVSHCDIIRGVVCHYLGLSLDHLLRFDIDPASVSTLEVGAWGGRLTSLNRAYA